ncbi:hypothetical protein D3C80_1991440 [compost metagenome]
MQAQLVCRIASDTRQQGIAAGIQADQDMGRVVCRAAFTHPHRQPIEDARGAVCGQGQAYIAGLNLDPQGTAHDMRRVGDAQEWRATAGQA